MSVIKLVAAEAIVDSSDQLRRVGRAISDLAVEVSDIITYARDSNERERLKKQENAITAALKQLEVEQGKLADPLKWTTAAKNAIAKKVKAAKK